MKNTLGNNISVTLFGESHGDSIGAVLDGIPAGVTVDDAFINHQLDLRRPSGKISTPRKEADAYKIISGVFNGKTTGTPICVVIPNENTKSASYELSYGKARPGHADYVAFEKYNGCEDYRGGGHFSGRVTAGLVATGAICIDLLKKKNIFIGTHIKKCAGVEDRAFDDLEKDIKELSVKEYPVLDSIQGEAMVKNIEKVAAEGDSVGGVLSTAVTGIPVGIGEPWFDSLESVLSHGLFSIPAIKGVEFGAGFSCADMKGSEMNDSFAIENGVVVTKTNNNGGINGGISNGMPILFNCVVKPTPSIAKSQETVDFINCENTVLSTKGRHDPCIVHRARVVVDSITAIVLCDMLSQKFGTDWLGAL